VVKTIALQTEGKISNGENHGYILDVCLILYGPFFPAKQGSSVVL
jgi:hypothetical protein